MEHRRSKVKVHQEATGRKEGRRDQTGGDKRKKWKKERKEKHTSEKREQARRWADVEIVERAREREKGAYIDRDKKEEESIPN